jgi:hypothetical protein
LYTASKERKEKVIKKLIKNEKQPILKSSILKLIWMMITIKRRNQNERINKKYQQTNNNNYNHINQSHHHENFEVSIWLHLIII